MLNSFCFLRNSKKKTYREILSGIEKKAGFASELKSGFTRSNPQLLSFFSLDPLSLMGRITLAEHPGTGNSEQF